jgi:predicted dehydrogenase
MAEVKVGVIGCGYWGPNLIRNFHKIEDCEMAMVADLNPERLKSMKASYPGLKVTSNHEELLTDPSIDAVAIATPVSTHYELAKQALLEGKHVLIEKPLTATVAEGEELVDLAEEKGKKLMVDHTFIYCGPVRKVAELINQGELGDIYYFDSVRVNLGLFRHDVNVIWDLAPHDFSIMDHLLGKTPVSLTAIGANHIGYPETHENIAYVAVNFDNHVLAHFHLNWLTPVKIRRTLVGGSKKMVIYDHLDPDNQVKVFDKGVDIENREDIHKTLIQYRTGDMYAPKIAQTEPLEEMARHFLDCIKTGKQPLTDGEAGLRVVKLLTACDRSMKNGSEAVKI